MQCRSPADRYLLHNGGVYDQRGADWRKLCRRVSEARKLISKHFILELFLILFRRRRRSFGVCCTFMTGSSMAAAMAGAATPGAMVTAGMGTGTMAAAATVRADVSQENAYIQNPGFPAALAATGEVTYMVSKKDQGNKLKSIKY